MGKPWHPGPVTAGNEEALRWRALCHEMAATRDEWEKRALAAETRALAAEQLLYEAEYTLRGMNTQSANGPSWLTESVWKRILALVHPDRHPGSSAAAEVTRVLLEHRPR